MSSNDELREVKQLIAQLRTQTDVDQILDTIQQLRRLSSGNGMTLPAHEQDLNKKTITREGCAGPLIKLLKSDNAALQCEATRLLRSISVVGISTNLRKDENVEEITEEGAVIPLIKLLSSPDDKIQLNAAATLWNLSVDDENKAEIAAQGGLTALLDLLKSTDYRIQGEAVGALHENKKIIAKEGGITTLINILKTGNPRLHKNTAIALSNLCYHNGKNRELIAAQGGFGPMLEVLKSNDIDVTILEDPSAETKDISVFVDDPNAIYWRDLKLGAYGDVYKAKFYGYPVVCKIIKKELREKDSAKTLEELRLMKRLRHPNVVLLIGACVNPVNQVVIVTEYCARGSLKDCLKDVKTLTTRLKLSKDLISGLNWMHAHSIIHRDLKLENLLATDDWTLKITDFGLSLHDTGAVITKFGGNVKYSSPEILRARADKNPNKIYPYSEKTDVYSFGYLLWELIQVRPLFPGVKGKKKLIKHILNGNRPKINHRWPKSLIELLEACWHVDAEKRPLFREIQSRFNNIVIDLMCPDVLGKKICRRIWKGDVLTGGGKKIPYQEFEKIFQEETGEQLIRFKPILAKCFQAVASDPVEGVVSFERFCNAVTWFGPVEPVQAFLESIHDLLRKGWFHGFMSREKAELLLRQHHPKHNYLFRFNMNQPGFFVLSYVNSKGEIKHNDIAHYITGSLSFSDFLQDLRKNCKSALKLRKACRGSPFKSLFN